VRIVVTAAILACAAGLTASPARAQDVEALLKKHSCTVCHKLDAKSAGPSFKKMAAEYGKDGDAPALLAERIKKGSVKVWGPTPMPAFPKLADADVTAIVSWILSR
jgi:cytochrome c551/c552